MADRVQMIERLSNSLDKQLMLLSLDIWRWKIHLAMPQINEIGFRWRALSNGKRHILDLSDRRTWDELHNLFRSANRWTAVEEHSGRVRRRQGPNRAPRFFNLIFGSGRALSSYARDAFPSTVLREVNRRRRDKGLMPFKKKDIKAGMQFTLSVHFE